MGNLWMYLLRFPHSALSCLPQSHCHRDCFPPDPYQVSSGRVEQPLSLHPGSTSSDPQSSRIISKSKCFTLLFKILWWAVMASQIKHNFIILHTVPCKIWFQLILLPPPSSHLTSFSLHTPCLSLTLLCSGHWLCVKSPSPFKKFPFLHISFQMSLSLETLHDFCMGQYKIPSCSRNRWYRLLYFNWTHHGMGVFPLCLNLSSLRATAMFPSSLLPALPLLLPALFLTAREHPRWFILQIGKLISVGKMGISCLERISIL